MVVLSPLRSTVGLRPAARRRCGPLVTASPRRRRNHPPLRRRHTDPRDDVPHGDRHRNPGRCPRRRTQRARPRARCRRAVSAAAPSDRRRRHRGVRARVRAPARIRPDLSALHSSGQWWSHRTGRSRRPPLVVSGRARGQRLHRHGPVRRARRRHRGVLPRLRDELGATTKVVVAGRDRRPARRHDRGMAHLVVAPSGIRRSVARPRPHERTRAVRPDVLPNGRDLRGGHHVTSRDAGRHAQLGLPLRVGPRRELHAPSTVGRGMPGRSRQVLRVHDARRGSADPPRLRPPDHVRHRRRT